MIRNGWRAVGPVAALLVAAGCGGEEDAGLAAPATDAGGGRGAADVASYEIAFMEGMIDHHVMALDMAEPCVAGAVHDELRALCEDILVTQQAEIERMRSWLAAWYGVGWTPGADGGGMAMPTTDLDALSGAELEIAFMREMIPHHMQAVRDARFCTARAEHEELAGLCEDIVTAQVAEIRQMRTWLCEWYAQCGMGPMRGGMRPMGGGGMSR